jgi:hypothetical protein
MRREEANLAEIESLPLATDMRRWDSADTKA